MSASGASGSDEEWSDAVESSYEGAASGEGVGASEEVGD